MAPEIPVTLRKDSKFRRGCEQAVQGNKSIVALDTWVTVGEGAALGKLDRTVGEDGDLNPSWPLIENILRTNPRPVLDALGAICGVRWEWVPADPAAALQAVLEMGGQLEHQMAEMRTQIAALCKAQSETVPPVRAVRARGAA